MSWADRALRDHRINKAIEEALKSPQYKKMEEENKVQITIESYCRFCLIACDYLQIKHNYKRNGMMNFLNYASNIMKNIGNEDFNDYFRDINEVMKEECGIDVMGVLGLEFEEVTDEKKKGE